MTIQRDGGRIDPEARNKGRLRWYSRVTKAKTAAAAHCSNISSPLNHGASSAITKATSLCAVCVQREPLHCVHLISLHRVTSLCAVNAQVAAGVITHWETAEAYLALGASMAWTWEQSVDKPSVKLTSVRSHV